MTKQTNTKILREAIGGILSAHGINDLALEIRLCEAFKKIYDAPEPRLAKDEILRSLQRGASKFAELQEIANKIEVSTGLRPVTPAWVDFIEFAWRESKEGKTIDKFLVWWNSDEWQRTHPQSKPDMWLVKWNLAFPAEITPEQLNQPTTSGGYR